MNHTVPTEIMERAAKVRLVGFDVDGVLTDGRLMLGDGGVEFKVFHSRDGQGLVMLRDSGVKIAVVTGRSSSVVAERMADLGIEYVYQGRSQKLPVFLSLLEELGLNAEQAAYVGDDLPDLPIIMRVGLGIAVADADTEVLSKAHWRTRLPGGFGAAREVCELIMRAQGKYTKYEMTES